MSLQLLWCPEAFTFTGARAERTADGKLIVHHLVCGALNEIAPNGMSDDGHELWKVVGEVRPAGAYLLGRTRVLAVVNKSETPRAKRLPTRLPSPCIRLRSAGALSSSGSF